tara:strand:+ start:4506 stop:4814 length:309 start_codon:yes stop_codon:yes gene_type:complete
MKQKEPQTFSEYYQYYLTLHRNRSCRRLHIVGQIFTILFATFVLSNGYWYFIPLIPFVVYPFAWSGHIFFEKNKPAAWSRPLWAKACDWVMLKDVITGRLEL